MFVPAPLDGEIRAPEDLCDGGGEECQSRYDGEERVRGTSRKLSKWGGVRHVGISFPFRPELFGMRRGDGSQVIEWIDRRRTFDVVPTIRRAATS